MIIPNDRFTYKELLLANNRDPNDCHKPDVRKMIDSYLKPRGYIYKQCRPTNGGSNQYRWIKASEHDIKRANGEYPNSYDTSWLKD